MNNQHNNNPKNSMLKDTVTSKKIAIIGSGVSGLTCAHYLVAEHDVTIFEVNDYLGGHVNTIDVTLKSPNRVKKDNIETSSIDTGFIVFNERTYPNFFRLLDELDVPFQKTDMSFSVKNPAINFEYNGHTLNTLLSQRKNILSPRFWRFAKDIVTFNKHIKQLRQDYQEAEQVVQELEIKVATIKPNIINKHKRNKANKQLAHKKAQLAKLSNETLGDYLAKQNYGNLFQDNYLLPMVSAIWSMGLEDSKTFPLIFFANFFDNHGLLDIVNRPQWFTIVGGSKQYVNKLVTRYASMGGKALVNTPVQSVSRSKHNEKGVCVTYQANGVEKTAHFDDVIFACHADVAKRLLTDINEQENRVLSAFSFTDNEAILHTDTTALPNKSLAWASWNYLLPTKRNHLNNQSNNQSTTDIKPVLTYHMNILQRLVKKHNYLVTLNEPVNDAQVIKRIDYRHPVYTIEVTNAQKQWQSISQQDAHTHFCGAYWFNGFHEDGVRSGVRVCEHLGVAVNVMDTVNPAHVNNTLEPNPEFLYKHIPVNADKKTRTLNKREVLSATTNTVLNDLF